MFRFISKPFKRWAFNRAKIYTNYYIKLYNIKYIIKFLNKRKKLAKLKNNNQLILDKSPLNFLWIGFIKIMFPNSKVIHTVRESKDTCFSCYKNLFANSLNFTYQKKELALFYNSYIDLMSFWNKKLDNFVHNINYEDLINDPKTNITKTLKFCDLDFEESCLKFYENKSPIKTMSAAQARQKIYKTSIKSYKKYEEKLFDLFDNLAQ